MNEVLSPSGEPRVELAGSVKPYSRHLIACFGTRGWPAKVEEEHPFGVALRQLCAQDVKITFSDAPPRESGQVDVLDFPSLRRFISVALDQLSGVADGTAPSVSEPNPWVFVCVHGTRDVRCGKCGPPVANRFVEEINARGLDWNIATTSHLGGHHFTGNVIVYPSGNWYGYVEPGDVADLIQCESQATRFERCFRGNGLRA